MPRPRKCRHVCQLPPVGTFGPPEGGTGTVVMTVDEYEAIRLIDHEGLSQEDCSTYMHIARATAQQIYASARQKLAQALVEGRTLRIEGGDFQLCDGHGSRCGGCGCRRRFRQMQKEEKIMRVAIPVDENGRDLCVSFGRAPLFLFHDPDSQETRLLPNPAADAEGGAGIQAAQFVVDQGATALITIRCGENAAELLKEADIAIYEAIKAPAEENLTALSEGKLAPLTRFHAGFQGIR